MKEDQKPQTSRVGLDEITNAIINQAILIHRDLGPGLLESVYDTLLARALARQGFNVQSQEAVRFECDGIVFIEAFRPDLIVNARVIVEVKSVEKINAVHKKQLLTYLRLMQLPVGLLINFGETTLRQGLCRIVNSLDPSESPILRVNRVDHNRAE